VPRRGRRTGFGRKRLEALGVDQQPHSGRGERHATAVAHEQRYIEVCFEQLHAHRDVRLNGMKLECSAGNGALPGHRDRHSSAGNRSLHYDSEDGIYAYVWKTEKNWSGTCRQLNVRLTDGSNHTALFQFR
jgi:hypothetical protein